MFYIRRPLFSYNMLRMAKVPITVVSEPKSHPKLRLASHINTITIDPDRLYLITSALHWEDPNQNGDYFEGGRNVVWECMRCAQKFLKDPECQHCPHCASTDLNDWEFDFFNKRGELLTKDDRGLWIYESWRGCPVHENHNEHITLG